MDHSPLLLLPPTSCFHTPTAVTQPHPQATFVVVRQSESKAGSNMATSTISLSSMVCSEVTGQANPDVDASITEGEEVCRCSGFSKLSLLLGLPRTSFLSALDSSNTVIQRKLGAKLLIGQNFQ